MPLYNKIPCRYLKNERQRKWKTQNDCQIYKKKIKIKKNENKAEKKFVKRKEKIYDESLIDDINRIFYSQNQVRSMIDEKNKTNK